MSISYRYGDSRVWEMIPGVLVWTTIVGALLLSFFAPSWAVIFIIVFDLYWLFRVVYFLIFLFLAWRKYRRVIAVDWEARFQTLKCSDRIHQLIFLPTYKENIGIIRATLESLDQSTFDSQKMIVVLAGEARAHEQFVGIAETLKGEYEGRFGGFVVTEHPTDLPDEIPGKGSNLNWAGHQMVDWLATHKPHVRDEDIIVSAFDVDTIAHPQYFSCLAYTYCTSENPTRSSYQPVALFSNNIWTATAPVRVAAFGTSFWLMAELTRPERLWTFSSHSMSWVMLKDVGFWQKDIVSEDSRIFLQAFARYDGAYRVTPIFLPVSMDAVTGKGYWEAIKALYEQQRRWAWGVEHLPAMIRLFRENKRIPRRKKALYLFNHLEGMFTWATAPMLIFLLGWLPLYLAQSNPTALIHAAPFTLEAIMQYAMVGIFASAILALLLLPPRPKTITRWWWVVMIAQWALLPITFVIFGAFPAIDAQTRLMIGKYLGFNVTKKQRT